MGTIEHVGVVYVSERMTMNSDTVSMYRLVSQRLAGEQCATPAEVVRWMGALQAQAYGQVLWAIGLRTHAATLADVERALAERHIILTWPFRGTLHAVPAADVRWMLKVSAQRTLRAAQSRREQLALDEATIERCAALFSHAMAGAKRLTRPALMALLNDAGIATAGQRGYHILWHLAQTGLICLGPLEGTQQTFVLLEEWAPAAHDLSRDEALVELARRYFTSHGPATLHDFARWTGLTIADARSGIGGAIHSLSAYTADGAEYWMGTDVARWTTPAATQVDLLPGFDEYVLGYKERADVLDPAHASKVVPGNNGIFLPTIVVGGKVVGTWSRTRRKNGLSLTVHPFAPLATPQECIAAAAQRYGDFIGVPITALDVREA